MDKNLQPLVLHTTIYKTGFLFHHWIFMCLLLKDCNLKTANKLPGSKLSAYFSHFIVLQNPKLQKTFDVTLLACYLKERQDFKSGAKGYFKMSAR